MTRSGRFRIIRLVDLVANRIMRKINDYQEI